MTDAKFSAESAPAPAAREHHYSFAHHTLRQAVQVDTKGFLALLSGENAQPFLESLWEQAGKTLDQDALCSSEGLVSSMARAGDHYQVLVTLPPPLHAGECYYVSIEVSFDKKRFLRRQEASIAFRTLEKGAWLSDAQRTIIGGWTDDNMHLHYGDGPRFISPESFKKQLCDLVV